MDHSSFYFGFLYSDFLFKGVSVTSVWGMITLCIGTATLTVLIEGLKSSHQVLFGSSLKILRNPNQPTESDPLIKPRVAFPVSIVFENFPHWPYRRPYSILANRTYFHMLRTSIYVLTVVLNYLIMLSVMTFNAYLLIAAVLGAGIGHLFFTSLLQPMTYFPYPDSGPQVSSTRISPGELTRSSYGATGTCDSGITSAPEGSESKPKRCYFYVQDYESNSPKKDPYPNPPCDKKKTTDVTHLCIKVEVEVHASNDHA